MKWATFASNWASLYYTMEDVQCSPGPYHLHYHSAGWFNEKYQTAAEAQDRISRLIQKSDIHLSRTVYIHEANENRPDLPALLKTALDDNEAGEDHSVDCLLDTSSRKFRVSRIGPESTIAKLWGVSPVSYPCLTGHSYDHAVSRAYPEVIRSGEPQYHLVYSAVTSPSGEVVWLPYQRVVLPLRIGRGRRGVRVVIELARVDIYPL